MTRERMNDGNRPPKLLNADRSRAREGVELIAVRWQHLTATRTSWIQELIAPDGPACRRVSSRPYAWAFVGFYDRYYPSVTGENYTRAARKRGDLIEVNWSQSGNQRRGLVRIEVVDLVAELGISVALDRSLGPAFAVARGYLFGIREQLAARIRKQAASL